MQGAIPDELEIVERLRLETDHSLLILGSLNHLLPLETAHSPTLSHANQQSLQAFLSRNQLLEKTLVHQRVVDLVVGLGATLRDVYKVEHQTLFAFEQNVIAAQSHQL